MYLKPAALVITNCYEYCAKEVREGIKQLREQNPDNEGLAERGNFSYINEWSVHSLCYHWGIARERTKDADCQFYMKFIIELIYNILGPIARLLLKFYRT